MIDGIAADLIRRVKLNHALKASISANRLLQWFQTCFVEDNELGTGPLTFAAVLFLQSIGDKISDAANSAGDALKGAAGDVKDAANSAANKVLFRLLLKPLLHSHRHVRSSQFRNSRLHLSIYSTCTPMHVHTQQPNITPLRDVHKRCTEFFQHPARRQQHLQYWLIVHLATATLSPSSMHVLMLCVLWSSGEGHCGRRR